MKYVFEITIRPGRVVEEYVELWKAESEIIQREPGAMGMRLHKNIADPKKLMAIATWESKELRDSAMKKLAPNPLFKSFERSRKRWLTSD